MEDWEFERTKSLFLERINEELERSKTSQSSRIFKVPPKLLDVRKSVFLPEIFSFGPFYFSEYLMYVDLKIRHLPRLFGGKFGDINESPKTTDDEEDIEYQSRSMLRLDDVLKAMIDLAGKAKDCYDEPGRSCCTDLNFIEVITIDGCFIIELLRLHKKYTTDDEEKQLGTYGGISYSPIFAARWHLPSLLRDLIKLENQLPFFVLEKLFFITASENEPSLQNLFATFFSFTLSLNEHIYMLDPSPMRNYAHALDLCWSLFIFPLQKGYRRKVFSIKNPKLMYSAQEFQDVGIRFIKKDDSHLLDISFDKRVLQVPPLSIDENMTVVLLNFVAYEQCDQSKKPYFTNYLLFLDSLINTVKDVEILRQNGIIRYPLGTEKEVVNLFNNFRKEMLYSFDQNYLSVDMNAINSHCETFYNSKWRFWWSNLKKEKFNNPWTCLSLFAAIILLTLTMLQTFYTVFPYYHLD